MKKILLLASVLVFAWSVAAQEQAPAPNYNHGDVWVFKVAEKGGQGQSTRALDGEYEITYKDGRFTVRVPGGERPETKQDLGQLRRMLNEPSEEHQFLQFPLIIGKQWETAFTSDSRGSSQPVRNSAETKVTGVEEVTTPMGAFRVFKIERFETEGRAGKKAISGKTVRESYTYYYSPDVRAIIKYTHERERGQNRHIDLIKYTPAP